MPNRIVVAGHLGMVRSAIVRQLLDTGGSRESIICRSRDEVDLTDQSAVRVLFETEHLDEF